MGLKQVIAVRHDLKLPKGKLAVQVAHASSEAMVRSDKELVSKWRECGMKKVVVRVEDEQQLYTVNDQAKEAGLTTALITDAGKTTIPAGTRTCVCIGPDEEDKIDKITGKLKMI